MKIICNGKDKEVKEGINIEELVIELGLNPDTVVVELDGKIILREDYISQALAEGAVLEIIRFVGGG